MTLDPRTSVLVRFPEGLLGRIERWQADGRAEEPSRPGTRHAAILHLIELGLNIGTDPRLAAKAEVREHLMDILKSPATIKQIEEILFE